MSALGIFNIIRHTREKWISFKHKMKSTGESKRKNERETGLEPVASTLARWRSTTELFPLNRIYIMQNIITHNRKKVKLNFFFVDKTITRMQGVQAKTINLFFF